MHFPQGLVLVPMLCLLASGCAISETYIRSKPHAPYATSKESPLYRKITTYEVPEFQFTVMPYNARLKSGTFYLTLIPIPYRGSPSKDRPIRFSSTTSTAEAPFIVEVGIRASSGELRFDTSMPAVSIMDKKVPCSGIILLPEGECTALDAWILSNCVPKYRRKARPPEIVAISNGTTKYALLLFDTSPPTPETQFSLEMNGIVKDGQMLSPVTVTFSPEEVNYSDTAP